MLIRRLMMDGRLCTRLPSKLIKTSVAIHLLTCHFAKDLPILRPQDISSNMVPLLLRAGSSTRLLWRSRIQFWRAVGRALTRIALGTKVTWVRQHCNTIPPQFHGIQVSALEMQ